MSENGKYRLNPVTLLYEIDKESRGSRLWRYLLFLVGTVLMSLVYVWLYVSVLGFQLPKTILLRKTNERLRSQVDMLDRRLDQYASTLQGLQMRDDGIYRNIFGMNSVSSEMRNSGFGGVNRYSYLEGLPENSQLVSVQSRLDLLTKKAYVQSKSFDEVAELSKRAGDMAACIPAICPFLPDLTKFRLTSPFGYRSDPMTGTAKMHTGFDFACPPGNLVYATGDGEVESVKFELFGYGNSVVVDHGFGYKTRYAHMRTIFVAEGMKVKRGECLGESGNSGRVTGPHLHYEVMYRDSYVNPADFMDLEMPLDEYRQMVKSAAASSSNVLTPHQRNRFK